jgi:hypothetical protein
MLLSAALCSPLQLSAALLARVSAVCLWRAGCCAPRLYAAVAFLA